MIFGNYRIINCRKRLFFFGLLLCGPLLAISASPAVIGAESAKLDVRQLMAALAKIQYSEASFIETKSMAVLNEPLILKGQLTYIAPNYLQKKILSPTPSTYTVDGLRINAEEQNKPPREFSLDESPLLQALIESLRGTLSGNLSMLMDYYEVSLVGNNDSWTLELDPLENDIKAYIEIIKISGQGILIKTIETIESNKDRSVIKLSDPKQ